MFYEITVTRGDFHFGEGTTERLALHPNFDEGNRALNRLRRELEGELRTYGENKPADRATGQLAEFAVRMREHAHLVGDHKVIPGQEAWFTFGEPGQEALYRLQPLEGSTDAPEALQGAQSAS